MSESLRHDTAWVCGLHLSQLVERLHRERRLNDFFGEAYVIVKAALESHDRLSDRVQRRLRPLDN